jgi:hypothetical protein
MSDNSPFLCGQVLPSADHHKAAVSKQSRKLRAFLQRLCEKDKEMPQGHIGFRDIATEEVTREVINFLGRDEVVFQHLEDLSVTNEQPRWTVKAVLEAFETNGFVTEGKSITVTGLHFFTYLFGVLKGRWTHCPNLTGNHQTRNQAYSSLSSEDRMANFLNQLVSETTTLTGPSRIKRLWSSKFCQNVLPGSAENRKPDMILLPEGKTPDWRNVVALAEMKQGVKFQDVDWFDECARRANTLWSCQDGRRFVMTMQLKGSAFSFMFFDRGGAVCPALLDINEDKEQFLRLVLYLTLGDPGACFEISCFRHRLTTSWQAWWVLTQRSTATAHLPSSNQRVGST